MASLGHVSIGLLAGRLWSGPERSAGGAMVVFATLSLAPDFDVLPLALGLEDAGLQGHRGFSHTLCFALLAGVMAEWLARGARGRRWNTGVLVFLTLASHGILDAATTDSRGIPLLWPLVSERLAAPVRPIPEAPTGLAFVSVRGLEVAAVELLIFLPTTLASLFPPRFLRTVRGRALLKTTAAFVVGLALSLVSARLWLEGSSEVARVWSPPDRQTAMRALTPTAPAARR